MSSQGQGSSSSVKMHRDDSAPRGSWSLPAPCVLPGGGGLKTLIQLTPPKSAHWRLRRNVPPFFLSLTSCLPCPPPPGVERHRLGLHLPLWESCRGSGGSGCRSSCRRQASDCTPDPHTPCTDSEPLPPKKGERIVSACCPHVLPGWRARVNLAMYLLN